MTLDLDPIRARLAAATPGPWHAWDRGIGSEVHVGAECVSETTQYERCRDLNDGFRETFAEADADLIANAPADMAALLAEVERLRVAVWRVREIHGLQVSSVWGEGCEECVDAYTERPKPYPCRTIRALGGVE